MLLWTLRTVNSSLSLQLGCNDAHSSTSKSISYGSSFHSFSVHSFICMELSLMTSMVRNPAGAVTVAHRALIWSFCSRFIRFSNFSLRSWQSPRHCLKILFLFFRFKIIRVLISGHAASEFDLHSESYDVMVKAVTDASRWDRIFEVLPTFSIM